MLKRAIIASMARLPMRGTSGWPVLSSDGLEKPDLRIGGDLPEVGGGEPVRGWTQVLAIAGGGQGGEKILAGDFAGAKAL
jgi:hypothetical protein